MRLNQTLSLGLLVAIIQFVFGITLPSGSAHATAVGKTEYHLFNPTPDTILREMSTDRPDRTESPYTVDAGRFQIESDLVTFSQNISKEGSTETTTKSTGFLNLNLKAGLTHRMDFHVVISPSTRTETEVTGQAKTTTSGFGRTLVRLKYNLFGNDDGHVAAALMPFVSLPTNADELGHKKTEYGLIVPVAVQLPGDWGMGVMLQANRMKNADDAGEYTVFISSMVIGTELTEDLGSYFEIYSESSDQANAVWIATFDAGLTYAFNANTQLDLGLNTGLTTSATDLNPFLGLSVRF